MEYLDLVIAKESRRTESALCAISVKNLGKESILTTLAPKKPVAQSIGSINVGQRVVGNILTYKVHDTYEDVSVCEEVKGNTFSPTINGNGRK